MLNMLFNILIDLTAFKTHSKNYENRIYCLDFTISWKRVLNNVIKRKENVFKTDFYP